MPCAARSTLQAPPHHDSTTHPTHHPPPQRHPDVPRHHPVLLASGNVVGDQLQGPQVSRSN